MTDTALRRHELAAFLRSRRERITPEDAGLPGGYRRRTAGLRREEVAELSGVGVTWYTWLEQGRNISTSVQVIDALARALLLAPDRETPSDDVRPRLRRLVDAVAPNIASIYDGHFDYLAWNRAYALVRHDP